MAGEGGGEANCEMDVACCWDAGWGKDKMRSGVLLTTPMVVLLRTGQNEIDIRGLLFLFTIFQVHRSSCISFDVDKLWQNPSRHGGERTGTQSRSDTVGSGGHAWANRGPGRETQAVQDFLHQGGHHTGSKDAERNHMWNSSDHKETLCGGIDPGLPNELVTIICHDSDSNPFPGRFDYLLDHHDCINLHDPFQTKEGPIGKHHCHDIS